MNRERSDNPQLDDPYEMLKATEQFERKRRYERKPKSSAQLISRLIASRGFTQSQWNDQLQTAWQQVVGTDFQGKTQATIIKRGVLEIIVNSSPAMQQLAFSKSQLLEKIQSQLPQSNIKSLRFKVGQIQSVKKRS